MDRGPERVRSSLTGALLSLVSDSELRTGRSSRVVRVSLLRSLVVAGTVGLSTMVVCFVAADRLAHTTFRAPPSMTIAQAPAAEPETTGTVTQQAEMPEAKARPMSGFDTERLNALMRGEMPPPPAPSRKR